MSFIGKKQKKNKIARRLGCNIFGRKKNPLLNKSTSIGMHVKGRKGKTPYAKKLNEMRKIKAVYGMLRRKTLVKYNRMANKKSRNANVNNVVIFIDLLESRFQTIVYRCNIASSIFHARQLISHKHFLVNGTRMNIASHLMRIGDIITFSNSSPMKENAKRDLESFNIGDYSTYVRFDSSNLSFEILAIPSIEQVKSYIPVEVNIPEVCNFLSYTS